MASPHKVEQAVRTNHFKVCAPERKDLAEFTRHVQYIDINEHAGAGADVIVGIVHPVTYPELPRSIKEGNVTFLRLDVFGNKGDKSPIYTMQFEECSLKHVHRRFDCHSHDPVIVEYTFHSKQIDVMVLDEKDDVDRSNWSDQDKKPRRLRRR